jgi:transposase
MSKPLYLVSEFFRTKSTEILIGKGISPDDLNDDTLGRALDEIAKCGPSKIFSTIALKAAKTYGIDISRLHGDTSNVQVWGDYPDGDLMAFGYPKQGRSDLKQYLLSLITTHDGAIPLFMGSIRGNTSDTKHFKELIELIEMSIKDNPGIYYFILDSAAYSEENIQKLDKVFLITRVPERIAAAKELKEAYAETPERMHGNDDYKFAEVDSTYGGVKQRWIVVYSREAYEREQKSIKAQVKKQKTELENALKKLNKQHCSCELDIEKEIVKLSKKYKFYNINVIKILRNERYIKTEKQ